MEVTVRIRAHEDCFCKEATSHVTNHLEHTDEQKKQLAKERLCIITDSQGGKDNMLITRCGFNFNSASEIEKGLNEDVIQLYFSLAGNGTLPDGKQNSFLCFSEMEHNICYIPASVSLQRYVSKTDIFVVTMPMKVYFDLIPKENEIHEHFIRKIKLKEPAYFKNTNLPVTASMFRLIQEVRQCERVGPLKRLYLESRVMELLMLQLEQATRTASIETIPCNETSKKITEAKLFLDAHFHCSPTIVALSKIIGLNEFKLKKHFKEQFGTTILAYVNHQKMAHAQQLIKEGAKSLGEISDIIGYKNPAHFTVAFKRHFGYLPSEFRYQ